MVETIISDQSITSSSEEVSDDDYRKLCEILIAAIPFDRREKRAGKVITYLAVETMQAISQGMGVPRVPTKAIYLDLGGNPNQEPSSWLSPIWNEIEERHYPEIEPILIDLCRQAGLATYPTIEKDNGKPAFYRIGWRAVPACNSGQVSIEEELPKHAIRYKRDLSLKLSSTGKLFFSEGLRWTPFKRYSYLTWQLLFLVVVAAFDLLLWLLLWYSKGPLSGQELVVLSMALGMPVGAYWHFREIFRLFDDRIIIAPDWILSLKEFGATVEINRSKDPEMASTILVQRYTSICPICGWMIKLDRGGPDFPRRIVGRCEEHPREHVFSFDRMTKRGEPLHCGKTLPNETKLSLPLDAS